MKNNNFIEIDCPICGKFHFSKSSAEEIELGIKEYTCYACGWVYDGSGIDDDSYCGKNNKSIKEYKNLYKKQIVKDKDFNFLKSNHKKEPHFCPVCGKHEFKDRNSFEICPVCGWQDDDVMESEPEN